MQGFRCNHQMVDGAAVKGSHHRQLHGEYLVPSEQFKQNRTCTSSSSNASHTHDRCGDVNTAGSQVSLNEYLLLLLACNHFAEYSLMSLIGFGKGFGVLMVPLLWGAGILPFLGPVTSAVPDGAC